jgi:hypothetical protein
VSDTVPGGPPISDLRLPCLESPCRAPPVPAGSRLLPPVAARRSRPGPTPLPAAWCSGPDPPPSSSPAMPFKGCRGRAVIFVALPFCPRGNSNGEPYLLPSLLVTPIAVVGHQSSPVFVKTPPTTVLLGELRLLV